MKKFTLRQKKVLFVCLRNGARSQIAEAWLNHLWGDRFEAQSAGLEAGQLNPLAIEVMKEVGIDISTNRTQRVFDIFKEGRLFSHVITVCDEASAARCPVFAGLTKRLHWSVADPSRTPGAHEHKLQEMRRVRDELRQLVKDWGTEMFRVYSRSMTRPRLTAV